MLNNYMGIFCFALCAYLFVNRLLHRFALFSCSFTLPHCSYLNLCITFSDKLP
jgi:hypothetical protein